VGLISTPPHHDIYSIEDLAQLIHDLRCANPTAEISVKLVALAGVGTVAAGVAKAGADHIVIAGMDGGTGASPTSSIRHAGVPWELGLAETQQVLVGNALRGRVRLQVDGGLRTGRDVIVGALLGAEEFGFSTAPLVAAGCIMMRVCHLNTCPVGIATQDPELRRRFAGTPEHVVQYLLFVAEEVREIMARLGVRRFEELVGRADLARQVSDGDAGIDLRALLATASGPAGSATRFAGVPAEQPAAPLDRELLALAGDALLRGERVTVARAVRNTDRAIGALLSGELVRRLGAGELAEGALTLRLTGTAGQSLGAWGIHGLVLDLEGQANDYVGKGLSGARIVVRPPANAGYAPATSIAIGNTTLYGATSGELYVRGCAGERFAVRNSGATAVVEGVGRHGCEYMTGGLVAVLGPVGRNFAAGMSGGVAYVWDPDGENARRVNSDMVALRPVADDAALRELVERHRELTGSDVAAALLADWDTAVAQFIEVMPHDLLRVAAERDPELEGARG
jgi:glutamate synthase domain-containing protein 3